MKPTKTTYDLGRTRFGQLLQLEETRDGWVLIQHASSHRDETQRIYVTPIIAAGILGVLA